MPAHPERPHVFGNFVTTLDGVTSLGEQNLAGGGEISGFNSHDQMVMGILRALADAVVVGAGTLRAVPRHLWTADHVFPALRDEYAEFRRSLGKNDPPLNVIVTGRGDVDFRLPVFNSDRVVALVVTTEEGESKLAGRGARDQSRIVAVPRSGELQAFEVLDAVREARQVAHVLVEGGPRLMGAFLSEGALDELFLTLSPQVAGRQEESYRPGLVDGVLFAPHRPLWASLRDVRRAENHLFLRYAFGSDR
jgi:riboflavin biosynthesis pyrimidine reductase